MADVQNVITLGIGSAPGSVRFFVLTGLDVGGAYTVSVGPTLRAGVSGARASVRGGEVVVAPRVEGAVAVTPVIGGTEEL